MQTDTLFIDCLLFTQPASPGFYCPGLTSLDSAAACYLLPIGVVLYTIFGGIKATFLTDYV